MDRKKKSVQRSAAPGRLELCVCETAYSRMHTHALLRVCVIAPDRPCDIERALNAVSPSCPELRSEL